MIIESPEQLDAYNFIKLRIEMEKIHNRRVKYEEDYVRLYEFLLKETSEDNNHLQQYRECYAKNK